MKPHLLLLYCGGTIGMRQDSKTSALQPSLSLKELLEFAPNLRHEFALQTATIANIDSTNIQPHHWTEVADRIGKEYENYDGFVVIHGTDTMSYTATALSLALGNLGKPVILTGAQVPPDILGSDASSNLINACQVASMDFAEVAIVFGTSILRGNRSMKVSESERNAFISPVFPNLGSIRLQPELTYSGVRKRHGGPLQLRSSFAGDVAVVKLMPGMQPHVLEAILDSKIDGLVLESFGPGGIPNRENSLIPCLKKAKEKKIPVLICTQCIYGTTRMYLYEVGQSALEFGVVPTGDMTPEAAYVKLKWVLGQTKSMETIMKMLHTDVAGEVTMTG